MSIKIYHFFDENGYYINSLMSSNQSKNSTDIELPTYDENTEKAKFNQELNQWEVEDIILNGEFFKKSLEEGEENKLITQIKTKEKDLYIDFNKLKEEKDKQLNEKYILSQECIVEDGLDQDGDKIIFKIILRTGEFGDLDLMESQKNLSKDYGASMIIVDGLRYEEGKLVKTGKSYIAYLTKDEWLSFFGLLINQSRLNWNIKNKMLKPSIATANGIEVLNLINLESAFTIPYKVILNDYISRNNGNIFLLNNQQNLTSIAYELNQIKQIF